MTTNTAIIILAVFLRSIGLLALAVVICAAVTSSEAEDEADHRHNK